MEIFSINIRAKMVLLLTALIATVAVSATAVAAPNETFDKVQVVSNSVAQDPVSFDAKQFPDGVLTYSFLRSYVKKEGAVAVRVFRNGNQRTTTYILRSKGSNDKGIFAVRRSKNGRYIAFKYGSGFGEYEDYQLFLLDSQTRQVKVISGEGLRFKDYFFSPDGKHIVYVKGGDFKGTIDAYGSEPLALIHYDIEKRNTRVVSRTKFLPLSITWRGANDLFFSAQAQPDKLPDLYRYNLKTARTALAFRNAYRPIFSPDGKKVAFFGSENPSKPLRLTPSWKFSAKYLALSVSNLDGSERIALDTQKGEYPQIFWSENTQWVYELKQFQESPKALYNLRTWDIGSRRKQDVLRISAKDFEANPKDIFFPQVLVIGQAQPGRVIVSVNERKGINQEGNLLIVSQQLRVLDLRRSTSLTLTQSDKFLSYDWHSL